VASFLPPDYPVYEVASVDEFSSLSESGFIPTREINTYLYKRRLSGSHLFQRVASFLHMKYLGNSFSLQMMFSSLSESGFIPTGVVYVIRRVFTLLVLISFREWLHSYLETIPVIG